MRYCIPLNTWEPFTAAVHTVEVRMPVRIADYRAIVMTYAQAQRLIFAYVVASNIHPGNLLARLSAFCARALILPALDHAKDATFTSHAKRQGNLKRSDKNWLHAGSTSPQISPGPTQPSQQNQAWTKLLKRKWGPPRSSSKHAPSSAATSSLQYALAKSREEAVAARAEAQAARAEAAALREHIAKLEAQIRTLAHKPGHFNYTNSYYIPTSCAQPTYRL
ncbi:hypothetical protein HPB51_000051 [Rhipicephalus microplus]|uniref:Uncharacterized protein n=1 Tax=Rhipicephalus microplus TaxID=6941 RepID=A0A9J6D317_RHIMP|nr:hypothetical protein HPB51_000051 [Rhipicephalus microplus]